MRRDSIPPSQPPPPSNHCPHSWRRGQSTLAPRLVGYAGLGNGVLPLTLNTSRLSLLTNPIPVLLVLLRLRLVLCVSLFPESAQPSSSHEKGLNRI
jgi:hypothetical protein